MRTEFGARRRGGPATGVPKRGPARSHHVVARQDERGLEMLRVHSGGRDQVLPVFTAGWAARGYLFAEAPGRDWYVRECSPGELVSLLLGVCADVGWVALDPRPGHRSAALADNVMPRENFVDYLLCTRSPSLLRRSGFGTVREPFANGGDPKGGLRRAAR